MGKNFLIPREPILVRHYWHVASWLESSREDGHDFRPRQSCGGTLALTHLLEVTLSCGDRSIDRVPFGSAISEKQTNRQKTNPEMVVPLEFRVICLLMLNLCYKTGYYGLFFAPSAANHTL